MVRILRDFRRRRISPATRQRRAVKWGDTKQLPSGRHVPGKVVGLELHKYMSFQAELTAEQVQQKVGGLGSTV
eukprot:639155-Heterocapsa_arctica.AAC.1